MDTSNNTKRKLVYNYKVNIIIYELTNVMACTSLAQPQQAVFVQEAADLHKRVAMTTETVKQVQESPNGHFAGFKDMLL